MTLSELTKRLPGRFWIRVEGPGGEGPTRVTLRVDRGELVPVVGAAGWAGEDAGVLVQVEAFYGWLEGEQFASWCDHAAETAAHFATKGRFPESNALRVDGLEGGATC